MKKVLVSLSGLLIVGFVALFIFGKEVRVVQKEIQISASTDVVWNTLTDINQWKSWNSTVKLAEGESTKGAKLNITINGNGKQDSNYQPVVIESTAPNNFRWRASMMNDFVFKNDRVFHLESRDGGTYLIHKEEFSGLMVPLMWGMLEEFVGKSLAKMNSDLKAKIEGSN